MGTSSIPGGVGSVHSESGIGSGHEAQHGGQHEAGLAVPLVFHNRTSHPLSIQVADADNATATVAAAATARIALGPGSKAADRAVAEVAVTGPGGAAVVQVATRAQVKWFNSNARAEGQREWMQAVPQTAQPHVFALQTRPQPSDPLDVHVLLFDRVNSAAWMSALPDLPLSALCIPGTHESLSRSGYPISACQSAEATVTKQLNDGIRFLDVRVTAKPPDGGDSAQVDPKQQKLYAYHGVQDQKIELGEALDKVYEFLAGAGKSECVFVSMKPEADARIMQECFEHVYLAPNKSKWFLEPRVPALGEARGKLILISRYGSSGDQPGGIHPPIWPNSSKEIFSYDLPSRQKVVTQDWYGIGSMGGLGEKFNMIKALLQQVGSDPDTLGLDFVSAAALPLALPPYAANGAMWYKGLNARLRDYVADLHFAQARGGAPVRSATLAPLMAVLNLDFYEHEPDLVQLLIQSNFA